MNHASQSHVTFDRSYGAGSDGGVVRFKHYGVNQHDKHIFEGERWVLVKRRSHWGGK